jgi:uncharacterized protein
MKVRLDPIRTEPFVWEERLAFAPAQLERPELLEISEVACEGRIEPVDTGWILRARLRYQQVLACDRCLAPIRLEADELLESLLVVEPPPRGEATEAQELGEDELGVVHLGGDQLDTEPLLIELIQLAVPSRPLCRPDCRGLCPQCGADRNNEPCRCEEQAADPRWAALAGLRERRGGE